MKFGLHVDDHSASCGLTTPPLIARYRLESINNDCKGGGESVIDDGVGDTRPSAPAPRRVGATPWAPRAGPRQR